MTLQKIFSTAYGLQYMGCFEQYMYLFTFYLVYIFYPFLSIFSDEQIVIW